MDMIREAANQSDAPSTQLRSFKGDVNLSCRRTCKIEGGAIVLKRQAESVVKGFEGDDQRQVRPAAVAHGVDEDLLGAKLRAKTLPFGRAERLGFGRDPGDSVRNISSSDAKVRAPCFSGAYQDVAASSESTPMRSAIDRETIAANER